MFVTKDDFNVIPYNLPNLAEVEDDFDAFVLEQTETALRALLGDKLYDAFIDGLEEASVPQRWIDLRDGVLYLDEQGKQRRWVGMQELTRPLIYSLWLRYGKDIVTGVAVVEAEVENNTAVNPSTRITMGQNDFARKAGNHCVPPSTLFQYLYLSGEKYLADIGGEESTIKLYVLKNFQDPGYENEFDL